MAAQEYGMDIDWAQADIEVGGKTLHYYRTGGKGKPRIVLTHGFTDNGLCWMQVAKALEPEWDVIMPDMRGHGLSARVKPGEDVDMPADLAGFIRALRLDKPVLCGHSMGAMTSFMATVRYPELVRALILEDPPWFMKPWPKAGPESLSNPIVEWARTLHSQSLESLLAGYRKDHPDWPEQLLFAMCESKTQLDPAIGDIMTEKMNPEEGHWTGLIASLRCPTLVLSADPALGGIVTPEVEAKIATLNPRVRVAKIRGAGHLIRFDAFNAFMKALNAFLAGL
jgi:pimeloyl-ACP methyl ester carboxylesterase